MTEHTPKPRSSGKVQWLLNEATGQMFACDFASGVDTLVATFDKNNPRWRQDMAFCSRARMKFDEHREAKLQAWLQQCLTALERSVKFVDDDETLALILEAIKGARQDGNTPGAQAG